jgi:hypothetical protein
MIESLIKLLQTIGNLKKGFFSSGREIKYVDAILHPKLRIDVKIGDLILWGCANRL